MNELIKKLEYAKNAVIWLINHDGGSVDFHGLLYWSEEVERLQREIRKIL